MDTALTVGIDALSITLVLALAAFGLAIIFGLIGVINLGHGAMLTLGAYFTWACTSAGVPFLPRWRSPRSASASSASCSSTSSSATSTTGRSRPCS